MGDSQSNPTDPTNEEQVLLWGRLDNWQGDNLVVLPHDVAEYWLLRVPVLACTTWGEVRAAVSPEVYREVLDLAGYGSFEDYTEHLQISGSVPLPGVNDEAAAQYAEVSEGFPEDDQPFDASTDIPACADGDWPADPLYMMNQHLPEEVLDEFAETYATSFNGDFSMIPWDTAAAALARLTALGFTLREDDRVSQLAME
jgi:hypothetical protein